LKRGGVAVADDPLGHIILKGKAVQETEGAVSTTSHNDRPKVAAPEDGLKILESAMIGGGKVAVGLLDLLWTVPFNDLIAVVQAAKSFGVSVGGSWGTGRCKDGDPISRAQRWGDDQGGRRLHVGSEAILID